ncbi:MAG: hypothetical protein JEZ07_09790 [Phycisphaerae bacterium]|nr:hypothetical protein [Phycisphaerae bacterium]
MKKQSNKTQIIVTIVTLFFLTACYFSFKFGSETGRTQGYSDAHDRYWNEIQELKAQVDTAIENSTWKAVSIRDTFFILELNGIRINFAFDGYRPNSEKTISKLQDQGLAKNWVIMPEEINEIDDEKVIWGKVTTHNNNDFQSLLIEKEWLLPIQTNK